MHPPTTDDISGITYQCCSVKEKEVCLLNELKVSFAMDDEFTWLNVAGREFNLNFTGTPYGSAAANPADDFADDTLFSNISYSFFFEATVLTNYSYVYDDPTLSSLELVEFTMSKGLHNNNKGGMEETQKNKEFFVERSIPNGYELCGVKGGKYLGCCNDTFPSYVDDFLFVSCIPKGSNAHTLGITMSSSVKGPKGTSIPSAYVVQYSQAAVDPFNATVLSMVTASTSQWNGTAYVGKFYLETPHAISDLVEVSATPF